MDLKHKRKAIIGITIWFASIPIAVLLGIIGDKWVAKTLYASNAINGGLFLSCALIQYCAFFWGGNHLAKAKGCSSIWLLFGLLWPLQAIIVLFLIFGSQDKFLDRSDQKLKSRRRKNETHAARVVRYRKNALILNFFGVVGLLFALVLIFAPIGLFDRQDDARVAAIFVFLPSYAAMIYGCWWWVRAKNWHEAVVFIGLMPLAVLMIPYVRLIYKIVPLLLPVFMFLMPVLLIGVVAVLPDKSGIPKLERWNRD